MINPHPTASSPPKRDSTIPPITKLELAVRLRYEGGTVVSLEIVPPLRSSERFQSKLEWNWLEGVKPAKPRGQTKESLAIPTRFLWLMLLHKLGVATIPSNVSRTISTMVENWAKNEKGNRTIRELFLEDPTTGHCRVAQIFDRPSLRSNKGKYINSIVLPLTSIFFRFEVVDDNSSKEVSFDTSLLKKLAEHIDAVSGCCVPNPLWKIENGVLRPFVSTSRVPQSSGDVKEQLSPFSYINSTDLPSTTIATPEHPITSGEVKPPQIQEPKRTDFAQVPIVTSNEKKETSSVLTNRQELRATSKIGASTAPSVTVQPKTQRQPTATITPSINLSKTASFGTKLKASFALAALSFASIGAFGIALLQPQSEQKKPNPIQRFSDIPTANESTSTKITLFFSNAASVRDYQNEFLRFAPAREILEQATRQKIEIDADVLQVRHKHVFAEVKSRSIEANGRFSVFFDKESTIIPGMLPRQIDANYSGTGTIFLVIVRNDGVAPAYEIINGDRETEQSFQYRFEVPENVFSDDALKLSFAAIVYHVGPSNINEFGLLIPKD